MSRGFHHLRLEDWARLRVELAWIYEGPVENAYLEETSPTSASRSSSSGRG